MNTAQPQRDRLWRLHPGLLALMRVDRTIVAANPSWTAALGWSEAELQGRDFLDLVHAGDLEKSRSAMSRLGAMIPLDPAQPDSRDAPVRLRNRCRGKDGAYHETAWTILRDGDDLYAIGEAAPATRSLEGSEALFREMRATQRFAGVVGHDFNNLLQGMTGSLDLIRRLIQMGRAGDTEKFIDAALSSARRAAALTERLHAFSSAGTADLRPVEVNGLLASIEGNLRRAAPPSIAIELRPAADSWRTLCDANGFEAALLNLVANACEAMPDGGAIVIETANATIGRTADEGVGPGQYVCVSVTDSGNGMTAEAIERAFDPFFSTKAAGQGNGLGLSFVYGFIRQLRGHAGISSAVGKGTTVTLYFPRVP